MKSANADEIFGVASDEIKSVPFFRHKADFTAKRFHPTKLDLSRPQGRI